LENSTGRQIRPEVTTELKCSDINNIYLYKADNFKDGGDRVVIAVTRGRQSCDVVPKSKKTKT